MKKMYRFLFAVAAAATALVGCVREPEMIPVAEESPVFFTAESIATRTAFADPEGTSYPTLWTANDQKVKVMLNMKDNKDVVVVPAADFKTASFTASFADTTTYTFFALSPASAWLSCQETVGEEQSYRLGITIPAAQTPLAKSVDEAAQILVAQSATTTTRPEKVSFQFKHWTAYGKMTLSNLALNGAKIEAVDLTAEEDWAGRWYYFFKDGSTTVNSGSKTITVNTTSTSDIWFACAPVDLSGKKLTVTVKTDKGTLTKEITMPANRKFESGQIATFTVNMSGITIKEPEVYELVTKSDDLTQGSKIIIAAASAEINQAISTTQNTNNRAVAEVAKADGKITDPASNVEIFTLEAGASSGTYAFKGLNGKYIYAPGTGNHMKSTDTKDAKASWNVTFKEGYVVVEASDASVTQRFIRYNPNKGNPMFSCYTETSSVRDSVALYKLVGSGGGEPPVEKKDPGLRIEKLSLTVNVGESAEIGIESIAEDYKGTITYLSSDESIATVDEEGMVLGVKAGTCSVTVTAPETDTYYSATKICTVTVTDPANAKTISELLALAAGKLDTATNTTIEESVDMGQATVVAVNGANVIAKDATGLLLVYKSNPSVEVGDVITASGALKNYYGIAELAATTITKVSSGATVDHGTPVTFDEAAITTFLAAPVVQYCKITGTLPANSSDYMTVGSQSVALYDKNMYAGKYGMAADVYGYTVGRGSKGQVNFLNINIEVNASSPFLSVDATSKTWAADATDAFTVNVSVEDGGSWTYTATGMDWATVTKNGNSLVVAPKAANTTTTANEGSVVLTNSADATKTATVTFKQSGVVTGSTFVLDQAAITAAHTEAWSYTSGEKTITAADGSLWTCYNTYATKGQVTVQMNKGKGSYVLTPSAPSGKKITHLVATCNSKSDGTGTASITRTFDISDGSTVVLSDIKGDDLTAGVDISGSHSQLKIYPNETNGGACYILNITITFE